MSCWPSKVVDRRDATVEWGKRGRCLPYTPLPNLALGQKKKYKNGTLLQNL